MQPFMPKRIREDKPPTQEGLRKGYCEGCGCMLMASDDQCPKCGGTRLTDIAPAPSELPYVTGRHPYISYQRL
jgi:hypothetical protein